MHQLLILLLIIFGCKPTVELNGDTGIDKFSFEKEETIGLVYTFTISPESAPNTFIIQNKDSLPKGTDVSRLKAKFSTINTLVKVKVNGVIQTSNVTINDFTKPVLYEAFAEDGTVKKYKVVVSVAKQPLRADKYVIINQTTFTETEIKTIVAKYGEQSNKRVAVGLGIIISVLNSAPATFLASLNNQLALAKKYDIPILVKFDTEYYWDYRPDLWNWWDPTIGGYNPDNKNNVEWYDWNSDAAIKICWLNWGKQMRKRPAPNLMSPAYINAWKVELTKGAQALKTWYDELPENKKFLLAGVVVGWESSIGANLFYIPNGNSYLTQPEANDPAIKRNMDMLPSRGVQATGYAAVKTAGIATSGTLTEQMLTEVVRRNLENLSKTVFDLGFSRNQIIVHGGGWAVGETLYSASINAYSCPGWSFYSDAADPTKDLTAMAALAKSDAPYWAAIEWLLQGTDKTQSDWTNALNKSIANKSRLVCIYNWGQINSNLAALEAIKSINK